MPDAYDPIPDLAYLLASALLEAARSPIEESAVRNLQDSLRLQPGDISFMSGRCDGVESKLRQALYSPRTVVSGLAGGELPTWGEIENHALSHLDSARSEMSEVRGWLRSDWRPVGSPLTVAAAETRSEVLRITDKVKRLIDEAKGIIHDGAAKERR